MYVCMLETSLKQPIRTQRAVNWDPNKPSIIINHLISLSNSLSPSILLSRTPIK